MVLSEIFSYVRRRLRDLDPSAYEYQDEDLLKALSDARRMLAVKQVAAMSGYAVSLAAGTISPEPTDEDGMILAGRVILDLLRSKFTELTSVGGFGTIWRSGLEEESSVEASKSFRNIMRLAEGELQELLLIKNRLTFSTRAQ